MVKISTVEKSDSSLVNALITRYKWGENTLNYGFKVQDIDKNGVSDFDEGAVAQFLQIDFRQRLKLHESGFP